VASQEDVLDQPRWDSGVRKALKTAEEEEKRDCPGFGPHSLRRANITWWQEVGGSSTETSKIAGHASTAITEEYTFVQKPRDELTRRIQDKRAKAAKKEKDKRSSRSDPRRRRRKAVLTSVPAVDAFRTLVHVAIPVQGFHMSVRTVAD
jgi:hypothetical protein